MEEWESNGTTQRYPTHCAWAATLARSPCPDSEHSPLQRGGRPTDLRAVPRGIPGRGSRVPWPEVDGPLSAPVPRPLPSNSWQFLIMHRPFPVALQGILLCALVLALASGGWGVHERDLNAGTALRMDLEQLVEGSDLVLEARVVSETPVLGADGLVYTDFDLEVQRTFWGDDLTSRSVRLPGGVLPTGRATIIPGMATLNTGDEALLMLSSEGPQGARVFCGLSQGCYRILTPFTGPRLATRDGSPEALLDEVTGALVPGMQSQVLDYADLVARCTAAASSKRARHGLESGIRAPGAGK